MQIKNETELLGAILTLFDSKDPYYTSFPETREAIIKLASIKEKTSEYHTHLQQLGSNLFTDADEYSRVHNMKWEALFNLEILEAIDKYVHPKID